MVGGGTARRAQGGRAYGAGRTRRDRVDLSARGLRRWRAAGISRGIGRIAGGGLFGSLGSKAAGAAVTFAATYALGRVAEVYYAGGRQLDPAALRELLARETGTARELFERHRGEVEARAKAIDVRQITSLVRDA